MLTYKFSTSWNSASVICCQGPLCYSPMTTACGMTLILCCLQKVSCQPSMPVRLPHHPHDLGGDLGDAAASSYPGVPNSSFLSNFQSLDTHLQQLGPSMDGAAGSGAGQPGNSPSEAMHLFGVSDADAYKLLQHPTTVLRSGPCWQLGSEGSPSQPQGRPPSPASLSALSGFDTNNGTSSSGSQGSAQPRQSGPPCDSTAYANTRRRSSKRLASKHAQHASEDSMPRAPAQRSPEADMKFRQILSRSLSEQQPSGSALLHRLSGSDTAVKQSSQEGCWRPHSHHKGPAPSDTKAVLTLDQALDSMSASQSCTQGLYNPFAAAAGDGAWQIPSRAEGSEGPDGRASSCSTATCHQDQLALTRPQQVCHRSLHLAFFALTALPAMPALPAMHALPALPAGLFRAQHCLRVLHNNSSRCKPFTRQHSRLTKKQFAAFPHIYACQHQGLARCGAYRGIHMS